MKDGKMQVSKRKRKQTNTEVKHGVVVRNI